MTQPTIKTFKRKINRQDAYYRIDQQRLQKAIEEEFGDVENFIKMTSISGRIIKRIFTMSNWLVNRNMLVRIANALNVNADYLVNGIYSYYTGAIEDYEQ